MTAESNVKLTITFSNPDLDADKQEREARNLRKEIKDLDVESVELVAVTEVPEGSKALGGFLPSVKTVASVANFKKLLGFLGSRLGSKSIELEVEANGKKLKVKASNREELVIAIEQAQKFVSGN